MKEGVFRNLGLKLFSLCLAFALWLVVAGEQREDHTLKVPLKLTRLPERMVLVNDPGDFVTVKLRGPKGGVRPGGKERRRQGTISDGPLRARIVSGWLGQRAK